MGAKDVHCTHQTVLQAALPNRTGQRPSRRANRVEKSRKLCCPQPHWYSLVYSHWGVADASG